MTKKITIFTLLAILILVPIGYFLLRDNGKITNYPPKNQTVVAFGDSLVEGMGATRGNDFVSIVGHNLGINIINKGVSGDTTGAALGRINDVIALNPGIVILLLGGNDELRRVPKIDTFQNLEKIIQDLQSNGAVIVLLGVRGGLLYDTREGDYKDLSKKYHTAYVSNVLDNLFGDSKYMSDGIHPNDLGNAIIAQRVTPVLKKVLK